MDSTTIYVVVTINTVADGSADLIDKTQHTSRLGAEEVYHTKLAAAAHNAQYPLAAVYLLTNRDQVIAAQFYEHDVQPTTEQE
jgi:hypothetical protein